MSDLPKALRERLERKVESHRGQSTDDGTLDAMYSFRAGAQALYALLLEGGFKYRGWADRIAKDLDSMCVVNLSEPSAGDLERVYHAYLDERAQVVQLTSALKKIVEMNDYADAEDVEKVARIALDKEKK